MNWPSLIIVVSLNLIHCWVKENLHRNSCFSYPGIHKLISEVKICLFLHIIHVFLKKLHIFNLFCLHMMFWRIKSDGELLLLQSLINFALQFFIYDLRLNFIRYIKKWFEFLIPKKAIFIFKKCNLACDFRRDTLFFVLINYCQPRKRIRVWHWINIRV